MEIYDIRKKINEIDDEILALLKKRFNLVEDVLRIKTDGDDEVDIFHPKRERQVIDRMLSQNNSNISDSDLGEIFKQIIIASRNLQDRKAANKKKFKIIIQGTKNSFNEFACKKYINIKKIPDYEVIYGISSKKVLTEITSGNISYGMVAFNNAHGGLVDETIKALSHNVYDIVDSIGLHVEHSLLVSKNFTGKIEKIYSHSQALKQCRNYINLNYKDANIYSYDGTATAARDLKKGIIKGAVIAHKSCAEEYDLQVIDTNIQDLRDDNETLFLVLKGKNI